MKKCFLLITALVILLCSLIPVAAQGNGTVYQTYQGSRYYYGILPSRSYGTQRQAIYDQLASQAETLHNDFITNYQDEVCLTINLDQFFQRDSNGRFNIEINWAVEETIAAFFHDNVQYCFLDKNFGISDDWSQYTISFYQLQPTVQYPALDFKQAADRRAMRDMIDATFQSYVELTQNADSKYEIARLVHDKIVSDWDYSSGRTLFPPGAHDLFGGMGYATDGIVCEAYSKTYAFVLNNLGVPAIFVAGDMVATDGFPAGGHAWNIVEMDDGKNYFADLTWADNQRTSQDIGNFRNPINYTWFLLGTDSGAFEARHYAGIGSFLGVYERPANMGGLDYDYETRHGLITFLTDLTADRSMGYDMGSYQMPAQGSLNFQPAYYDTNLVYGIDYEIRFEEPLQLGKNRVWFVGKGDYRGMDFGMVNLVDSSTTIDLTVEIDSPTYEYTGNSITPVPIVKNGMIILQEGIDYSVAYENNIECGTARVIVTGMGRYTGIYTKDFQIITISEGIHLTASQFSLIYPEISSALVVISQNDGSRISENHHRYALQALQEAADFYGLPIYYLDYFEEDPSAYLFYQEMLERFYSNGSYSDIEYYPLFGIFKSPSNFAVFAASAITTDGGYYSFSFEFDLHSEIEKVLMAEEPNPDDPTEDNAKIDTAKRLIEGSVYSVMQADVADISQARNAVTAIINSLALNGVSAVVDDGTFTAAVAGTEENQAGTDGSYTFTVNLSKGIGTPVTTVVNTLTITATPYQGTEPEPELPVIGFPLSIKAAFVDSRLAYGTWMKDNLTASLSPCTWTGNSTSAMPRFYSEAVSIEEAGRYYFVMAENARWSLDGTCKAIAVTVGEDGSIAVQGYDIAGNALSTVNANAFLSYESGDLSQPVVSWGGIPDGNVVME